MEGQDETVPLGGWKRRILLYNLKAVVLLAVWEFESWRQLEG
jgi:hypothetical protein